MLILFLCLFCDSENTNKNNNTIRSTATSLLSPTFDSPTNFNDSDSPPSANHQNNQQDCYNNIENPYSESDDEYYYHIGYDHLFRNSYNNNNNIDINDHKQEKENDEKDNR